MARRRPRLRTFDYVGRFRYFLTFCTHGRHDVFSTRSVVDLVLSHILRTATDEAFDVLAHVAMPDHMHLLVKGGHDAADLRRFVSRAKQHAAFAYARVFGGRLWQPGFYDHVLRDDESELPYIRYIVENPVHERLVAKPEDYPYLATGSVPIVEMIAMLESAGVKVWKPPQRKAVAG